MSLFNTIVPPSSPNYPWSACRTNNSGGGVDNGHFENANSFHPGGCNFGFCDGSVKFLKQTISVRAYMALSTRAAGEVISADQY